MCFHAQCAQGTISPPPLSFYLLPAFQAVWSCRLPCPLLGQARFPQRLVQGGREVVVKWAAQSFGLLDPKLCYLLDGILFIYGVIVTALFLRAKFSRSADAPAYQQGQNPVYNELNVGRREEYAVLDRRGGFDPEMGGKPRKKNPHEVVYNELRKDKMAEAYSEIGMKSDNQRRRGKGQDGLYQGLSKATKDTYDALHMQALPPR
ncbi:T-cell surface glycoprotein CD3 zeta chain isoform X2 [Odocoileus virginianus]|uniref:T-cell surface glycoprotein CD3 zeta chain n=1 Tax=Odocoileus virginianus TaxID=9874 RepID=A0ABM4HTE9_ODOVR